MKYLLLLSYLFLAYSCSALEKNEIRPLRINETILKAEIADTPQKREKGLMLREDLPKDGECSLSLKGKKKYLSG